MTTLHAERICLRRFRHDDYPTLVSMMADPEVTRFTGFRTPQSPQQVRERLDGWASHGGDALGVWAADDQDSGAFVGWFMLKETGKAAPELGFMLPQSQWGQGFATEGSRRLLRYAFSELELPLVVACVDHDNLASQRVLRKLGMSREPNDSNDALLLYGVRRPSV